MRIILHRGGNFNEARFEASPKPQEVPDKFARAMIARGVAEKATAAPTAKPKARATKED